MPLWKGRIRLGLLEIPVSLYAGEGREDLEFTLLDRRDQAPVGYRRFNKATGEEVPAEEVVRGYDMGEGKYVILTDEDLRQASVERTPRIDIVAFVPPEQIEPVYYDRPYFVEPIGEAGEKGYALLREALHRSRKVGIVRLVLRTRGYLAAVYPRQSLLVVNLLRWAHELRDPSGLNVPSPDLAAVGIQEDDVDAALRLVGGMTESWSPTQYRDEYREDLLRFIAGKGAAHAPPTAPEPEPEVEVAPADMKAVLLRSARKAEETRSGKRRQTG